MPRGEGNFVNADRASRKTHGVTNFVTEGATMRKCVMGSGPTPTPTVWLPDHLKHDEWARVQELREHAKKNGYPLHGSGQVNARYYPHQLLPPSEAKFSRKVHPGGY